MKNIQYQQKAVSELVEKTIGLLSLSGNRHTLIFKAPKDRYGIGDAHAAER